MTLDGSCMLSFLQLLKAPETTSELLVEVLGTLGNLNIPQFGAATLPPAHPLSHDLCTPSLW